ncbi:MAG TPA: ATP-dependent zinc metalloprotease FtsH [Gemmatimonadaceae bacterium]
MPGRERPPVDSAQRPPHHRLSQVMWLVLAVALLFGPELFSRGQERRRVPYSTFVALLDSNRVAKVEVGDASIRATLKAPDSAGRREVEVNRVDPALVAELRNRGVEFSSTPSGGWFSGLLVWMLPTLLLLAVWIFIARRSVAQQASSVLGIGRSRARIYAEQDTKVTFDDVAGIDEAKAELKEVVSFLRDPKGFARLGAHMPKGVLLIGPPGTGKTLLARAVAGEAGVPFFSINGSEFVELFVGVGAARVRDLFEQARRMAPCIIFIDEIDALGRARGASSLVGTNDEKEQTLNQLLAELDGFNPESGVVLLAATNRPEILDPALLRAGRFDRQVLVDRPDRLGRAQILRVHAKKIVLAAQLDLDHVAGLTPGFTGADLATLVNEAALVATRRSADAVSIEDFTNAVERVVAGLAKKSRVLSPRERAITAHHEMGHALVALATPGADPVQKVSIIPHGLSALGYTLQRPAEERYITTRHELEGKLTVLLGGRAAEIVAFGELSTGAADDLTRATLLAREMVARFGMDETIGNVVYAAPTGALEQPASLAELEPRAYSEQTAREIELGVRSLTQQALDRAVAILTRNRAALNAGAALLIERETLTRDELPHVLADESGGPHLTPPVPVQLAS